MVSLGCDISTRKVAIAGIREDGTIVTRALQLNPDARGARRLVGARMVAHAALGGHRHEAAVIVVELPMMQRPNNDLLGIAFCVEEAAQSACTGAIVLRRMASQWKAATLGAGHGNAGKPEVMVYARTLGYEGDDQDIADALVMAEAGWIEFRAAEKRPRRAA